MWFDVSVRFLTGLGGVRCRHNAVAQHGRGSYRRTHNFSGRRRMRGDCLSNDSVNFLTGNLFADRLFKIRPAANAQSGHDNSIRQIRPSPYCRRDVVTYLVRI